MTPKSATDVMQDIIFAAVIDAMTALSAGGLPNTILRDLNALHTNTTFADLPKEMQAAITASVRSAFTRLLKEGYSIAPGTGAPPRGPAPQRSPTGRPPGNRPPPRGDAPRRDQRGPRGDRPAGDRPRGPGRPGGDRRPGGGGPGGGGPGKPRGPRGPKPS